MQRVTPGIGPSFQPMVDKLRDAFLLALFKVITTEIPGRLVTGFPVKKAVIALPDPTHTDGANWTAFCVITGHIVAALPRTVEFQSGDHFLLLLPTPALLRHGILITLVQGTTSQASSDVLST